MKFTALHSFDNERQSDAQPDTRLLAWFFAALYLIGSLVYGFLSKAPWDDDCVVRFFNTLAAWNDPSMIFSLWNRPLFVILFMPAAKLGKTAVMIQMILICASAGLALFEALRKLRVGQAFMVLPLFYFQLFYFTITRNNLTEPLAVALICWGFFAMVNKKWLWFALCGALLPLARLELAMVLPIWILVLVREKQWTLLLPFFILPALLALGGYLFGGKEGLFWLIDETLGKETQKNRYGYREWAHYFERFEFVIGGPIFYFLFIGLGDRFFRKKLDLFVTVQFIAIFGLYVVFSTKLNMGNSAGFLRNLIPLTPLIAILAFIGYDRWTRVLFKQKEQLNEDIEVAFSAAKARKKGRLTEEERSALRVVQRQERYVMVTHALSIGALLIVHFFYSKVLKGHHKITTTPDHTDALLIVGLAVVLLLSSLFRTPTGVMKKPIILTGLVLGVGMMGYCMWKEPPDAHLSPERVAVSQFSDMFNGSYLEQFPVLVNHSWFFWSNDMQPDPEQFRTLTKQAIKDASPGSLFFWENHYSHRLAGDVQLNHISSDPNLVELCRNVSSDHRFTIALFQKKGEGYDAQTLRSMFDQAFPDSPYGHYARSVRARERGDRASAMQHVQKALERDKTWSEAVLLKGAILFDQKKFADALPFFQHATTLDTAYTQAKYFQAVCHNSLGQHDKAIPILEMIIDRNSKFAPAYEQLGLSHFKKGEHAAALHRFDEFLERKPKSANGYLNRGSCHFQERQFTLALADFDQAVRLAPKMAKAHVNRGITLFKLNKVENACPSFRKALELGENSASGYISQYCQ